MRVFKSVTKKAAGNVTSLAPPVHAFMVKNKLVYLCIWRVYLVDVHFGGVPMRCEV